MNCATGAGRRARGEEILRVAAEAFATQPSEFWCAQMRDAGILNERVNAYDDLFAHPQTSEMNVFTWPEQAVAGKVPYPNVPGPQPFEAGEPRAKAAAHRMTGWIKTATNGKPERIAAGYDLDGKILDRNDRVIDFSRFDVGGVNSSAEAGKLNAYLFSDRGIYRPGETVRVMALLRDDAGRPTDFPARLTVRRPNGQVFLVNISGRGDKDMPILAQYPMGAAERQGSQHAAA